MTTETLGDRLKAARKDRGVDDVVDEYKSRWGKHRGISRGSLPRWEKNEGRPNEIVLARLAKLYKMELSDLDPEAEAAILEFAPRGRVAPGGDSADVGRAGVEPASPGLKVQHSAIELPAQDIDLTDPEGTQPAGSVLIAA